MIENAGSRTVSEHRSRLLGKEASTSGPLLPVRDSLKDNIGSITLVLGPIVDDGRHDALPEQASSVAGGIDDVVAKAKNMAAGAR